MQKPKSRGGYAATTKGASRWLTKLSGDDVS
jgi:hypothetical protein